MTDNAPITAVEAAPFACRAGVKSFCESAGLDYYVLLSTGYPLEVLRAVGCTITDGVLDQIMARRAEVSDGQ